MTVQDALIDLGDYHEELAKFNWNYNLISDENVWRMYFNHHILLEQYSRQSPQHRAIWDWFTTRRSTSKETLPC